MYPILVILFIVSTTSGVPINLVQKVAENDFEKLDNYLPKPGDFPKFHYSTFGNTDGDDVLLNMIEFKSPKIDVKDSLLVSQETTTTAPETTTLYETETTTQFLLDNEQLNPIFIDGSSDDNTNRTIRQKNNNDVEVSNDSNNDKEKESQESDEEEEEPNMVTGLISAFLSGLSRPDGSVDVEAITALLGSLSTQNPDGSYDFNGLTELLMSFFGGGGEEGGGSDFGAFLGGLAGAFIKGVANPPGAKGSGIFVGNLLTGILPALSAPAPTEEGQTEKPQPSLDSGGFLGGLLSTLLGSSGSLSAGSSGGNNQAGGGGGGGGSKFSLFKAIFSTITSIFSSSSSAH